MWLEQQLPGSQDQTDFAVAAIPPLTFGVASQRSGNDDKAFDLSHECNLLLVLCSIREPSAVGFAGRLPSVATDERTRGSTSAAI